MSRLGRIPRQLDTSISDVEAAGAIGTLPNWVQLLGSRQVNDLVFYSWQEVVPFQDQYPAANKEPRFVYKPGGLYGTLASVNQGLAAPSSSSLVAVYPTLTATAGFVTPSPTTDFNIAISQNWASVPLNAFVQLKLGYFDVNYNWVYEIEYGNPTVIAIINNPTPNSLGLYDASIQYYNPVTQIWTKISDIWLRDANA